MHRLAVALTGCCVAFAVLAQPDQAPSDLNDNELDAAVVFAERDRDRALERYREKLASPTFSAGLGSVVIQSVPTPLNQELLDGFSDSDREELQLLYEAWEDAANRLQALRGEIRLRCQAENDNPRLARLCGRLN